MLLGGHKSVIYTDSMWTMCVFIINGKFTVYLFGLLQLKMCDTSLFHLSVNFNIVMRRTETFEIAPTFPSGSCRNNILVVLCRKSLNFYSSGNEINNSGKPIEKPLLILASV